ncbi:MAG: hypothetical protein N2422_06075 [Rhodobacteraceae bacterium]|nr:hypothetical protein [Paracoccaceae bacterium]
MRPIPAFVLPPLAALALAVIAAAPAGADSTNAAPVIEMTTVPVDVARLPWIGDDTRKFVADTQARFKSGQVAAYVFAASPNGNWGLRTAEGGTTPPSIADLARQALEQCEYFYVLPCRIMAINGMAMQDGTGGWAAQPYMLAPEPARFDFERVPFVGEHDRQLLRDYAFQSSPKALAVSDGGFWSWKGADTVQDAITLAMNDCKTGNGNQDCYLYAVNDFVVMDFKR